MEKKQLEALPINRAGSLSPKERDSHLQEIASYTGRVRKIIKYYEENPLRISPNIDYLEQVLDDYEIMLDEAKKEGIITQGSDSETWRTYADLDKLVTKATQGDKK